jgi:hypothetical protein
VSWRSSRLSILAQGEGELAELSLVNSLAERSNQVLAQGEEGELAELALVVFSSGEKASWQSSRRLVFRGGGVTGRVLQTLFQFNGRCS